MAAVETSLKRLTTFLRLYRQRRDLADGGRSPAAASVKHRRCRTYSPEKTHAKGRASRELNIGVRTVQR